MGIPSRDIVTKQIETFVLPSLASRIVDLQPDPRGGYFALVDVAPPAQDGNRGLIFQFDDAHNIVASWPFSVVNLADPNPSLFHLDSAAMSVGPAGIFVVGTVSARALAVPTVLFVAKFTLDGSYLWDKVYTPRLLDGCRVPATVRCSARGIARLAEPNENRMMILFQTAAMYDGVGEPRPDDSIGAGVFTIDDDGNVTGHLTRVFGRGQVMPARLRLLPGFGPTIVGRTRVTYPFIEKWQGYWARFDNDGNPLFETGYDIGADMTLNDIAESEGTTLAVGVVESRGGRSAVALRMNSVGNLHWLGQYDAPIGGEFFTSELTTLRVHHGAFVAGGYIDPSTSFQRPWLLRLDPESPTPFWHKRYVMNDVRSSLTTSFHALLFDRAERVVAGGDIFHRRPQGGGFFIERLPFLAVSEVDEGFDLPSCSEPTEISVNMQVPGQTFGSLWMDRMAMEYVEWSGGTTLNDFVLETLCTGAV